MGVPVANETFRIRGGRCIPADGDTLCSPKKARTKDRFWAPSGTFILYPTGPLLPFSCPSFLASSQSLSLSRSRVEDLRARMLFFLLDLVVFQFRAFLVVSVAWGWFCLCRLQDYLYWTQGARCRVGYHSQVWMRRGCFDGRKGWFLPSHGWSLMSFSDQLTRSSCFCCIMVSIFSRFSGSISHSSRVDSCWMVLGCSGTRWKKTSPDRRKQYVLGGILRSLWFKYVAHRLGVEKFSLDNFILGPRCTEFWR